MHYLLSAHLVQNVALAEWIPLLLVASVPPELAARLARFRLVQAPDPAAGRAAALARRLHGLARPGRLRRRPRAPRAPPPRAPDLLRDRAPALVARAPVAPVEPLVGGEVRLPLRGVRLREPARPPARAPPESALRLLRRRPAAVRPRPRSRTSSSPGSRWRSSEAIVFFAMFTVFFVRFMAEEERARRSSRAPDDQRPGNFFAASRTCSTSSVISSSPTCSS